MGRRGRCAISPREAGGDARQPQVAVAADRTATVTWQIFNGTNTGVQAVRLSAADGTPGPVRDLSAADAEANSPQVAVAPDGTPTVTWQTWTGMNPGVQTVRLSALDGTPGPVRDLFAAGEDAEQSKVAVAADGTPTVTWMAWNQSTHNYVVHAVRLSGADGTPRTVSDLSAVGDYARLFDEAPERPLPAEEAIRAARRHFAQERLAV